MILHVAEKAGSVCDQVFVATDDERIASLVSHHGLKVILTGSHHRSGTERCAEVLDRLDNQIPSDHIVINLQGDEPFFPPEILTRLANLFADDSCEIATCIHPVTDPEVIMNPNRVKVVTDNRLNALYFSRSPIPYAGSSKQVGYQHIGIYAYRVNILREIVGLKPGRLEMIESLEQLRWIENGYSIRCLETDYQGFGIDTPEDLIKAEAQFGKI